MSFSHPLARNAAVWATGGASGRPKKVLVVVTTLDLSPNDKRFKADKVATLSDAAKQWLEQNPSEATDYMLVNRAKDWPKAAEPG